MCSGPQQELEGPPVAAALLPACGYTPEACARICYLIGRHHTYTDIDGADYQILVEADFLVNIFENGMEQEAARKVRDNIFKTKTGKKAADRSLPLSCAFPTDNLKNERII